MRRNPAARTHTSEQRGGGGKPMSGFLQEGCPTSIAAELDSRANMLEPEVAEGFEGNVATLFFAEYGLRVIPSLTTRAGRQGWRSALATISPNQGGTMVKFPDEKWRRRDSCDLIAIRRHIPMARRTISRGKLRGNRDAPVHCRRL
jgi:hypothetical protein